MFCRLCEKIKASSHEVRMAGVLVLLMLVGFVIVIYSMMRTDGSSINLDYPFEFGKINFFQELGRTVVVANNAEVFIIEGEPCRWHTPLGSMDRNVATIFTDYVPGIGGTLWLVTEAGATQIAENVVSSMMSSSGRGILYFTDVDEMYNTGALYLYNTEEGRSRRVADEAFNAPSRITLSPDGRSVGYVVGVPVEWEESYAMAWPIGSGPFTRFVGYLVINGERERLGEDTFPIAIADDGKYVYFVRFPDEESREDTIQWWERRWVLYARSEGEETLVHSGTGSFGYLLFNRDLSQLIIGTEEGTYISRNGQKGERAEYSVGNLLCPMWPLLLPLNIGGAHFQWVDCFANQVAFGGGGAGGPSLVYIDAEFKISLIPGTYGVDFSYPFHPQLVDNGNIVFFLENPYGPAAHTFGGPPTRAFNLHRVVVADGEAEVLAEKVRSFYASADGRFVYFRNEENELWVIKDAQEPQLIAENVSRHIAMWAGSHKVFFVVDWEVGHGGSLYYSDGGRAPQRVAGADYVISIVAYPNHILYLKANRDVYRSIGDGNFDLVSEGRLRPEGKWVIDWRLPPNYEWIAEEDWDRR